MNKNKCTQKQTNFKTIKAERNRRYETISNYHIYDKRLSLELKGLLTYLLILPQDFKISLEKTSAYLGISKHTFIKYLNQLKDLGYLEMNKISHNKYEYIIKERSTKSPFKAELIDKYTIKDLASYYNDTKTPIEYKNLIKKTLESALNDENDFNNIIKEIASFKPKNDGLKTTYKAEQDEQNNIIDDDDFLPF